MQPYFMPDPCAQCDKTACASADTYKCAQFHDLFVQSWDDTVAYLRQQLLPQKEED